MEEKHLNQYDQYVKEVEEDIADLKKEYQQYIKGTG